MLISSSRVDNFLLSGQNVTCTRGFVLQSDWYRQSKAPEVDNFSRGCYQALSSPPFLRREPGDEAKGIHSFQAHSQTQSTQSQQSQSPQPSTLRLQQRPPTPASIHIAQFFVNLHNVVLQYLQDQRFGQSPHIMERH